MKNSIDVEAAVASLEDGTDAERVDTFVTLSNLSHGQPEAFTPYVDEICPFVDHEDRNIRSFVATILANVARYDPNVMVSHADAVCTLLADDDSRVLSFAAAAAVEIADVSPEKLLSETDRLFELLPYEDTQASRAARSIRMRAILALTYLVDANPTLAARFDAPLAERLDDAESEVRAVSVMSVAGFGVEHPEAVSTALAHLPARLNDSDSETRRHAVGAYVNFRHKQPDAIINPEKVAPAFEEAADQVDLDNEDVEKVSETCRYIKKLAASQ